jgi:hypothetical protein
MTTDDIILVSVTQVVGLGLKNSELLSCFAPSYFRRYLFGSFCGYKWTEAVQCLIHHTFPSWMMFSGRCFHE